MPDETQPETSAPIQPRPKRRQGFACMTAEQRSSIARLGGQAVQFAGTGHRWNAETGSAAGKRKRIRRPIRNVESAGHEGKRLAEGWDDMARLDTTKSE